VIVTPCTRLSITTNAGILPMGRSGVSPEHFVRAADMRSVSFGALRRKQLPRTFGRLEARRPHRQDACATDALALHAPPETDNCASALWLLSFARASSLFRFASSCFLHLAKSIHSARCRKSSGSNPIRQRSGRMPRSNTLRDLRLQGRRQKLHTKLVRQRRSHG
jgi:hypothetical protein